MLGVEGYSLVAIGIILAVLIVLSVIIFINVRKRKVKASKLKFNPNQIKDVDSFKPISVLDEVQRVQSQEDVKEMERMQNMENEK